MDPATIFWFSIGFVAGAMFMFLFRGGSFSYKTWHKETLQMKCKNHGWIDLYKHYSREQIEIMQRQDTWQCPMCVKERQEAASDVAKLEVR